MTRVPVRQRLGGALVACLCIWAARQAGAQSTPFDTVAYLHRAWAATGRPWLARYAGMQWDAVSKSWRLDDSWSHAHDDVAQQAYYAEYALRPALNLALKRNDLSLLDELANFYEGFLPRFTTLGALRARAGLRTSAALLDGQGRDSQRTLAWLEHAKLRDRIRECTNCNAQFLHPASRLLRAIAALPEVQRTPAMKRFALDYGKLLVEDHLIRLGFEARSMVSGLAGSPATLVATWDSYVDGRRTPAHYQRAMTDRDLWLVAAAAEVLGAASADPTLVRLGENAARLRQLVGSGVKYFQSSRRVYNDTRDFTGRHVQSASYFNGDFVNHRDMAYAGYTGDRFPSPGDTASEPNVSWDISHAYRIPVVLRSLADTRGASGTSFPSDEDLRLVTNQYAYRVFERDLTRPLFHNFFDGSDGWYRVNYAGRTGTAYPPSRLCDNRTANKRCLSIGALMGWGQLCAWNVDVQAVMNSILLLASSTDSESIAFRDRYYQSGRERLRWRNPAGIEEYPLILFAVLAELPSTFTRSMRNG